jgi:hypothetical protein
MNNLLSYFRKNSEKTIFNLVYKNYLKCKFSQSEIYKFSNFFHNFHEQALKANSPCMSDSLVLEGDDLYISPSLNSVKNKFCNSSPLDLITLPLESKTLEFPEAFYKIIFIIIKYYAK